MNNQVNSTANQLSQAIEALTDNIASNEKQAIIQATEKMFSAKLESKLSQARNEAIVDIQNSLMAIATQHQASVAEHLSEKILTAEANSVVSEPLQLEWSLKPIDLQAQLSAARDEQTNMRLIASEDEVNSWIDG
ncbi:hypothetical protein [Pleurocapsa sp. FMAR1]|uniref:hypothetical protein n=1 Tax=Pleurocapsa sp. FMAR1 TaxID=3040204 RepID=UPI0029C7C438|nr:hypothetical protein [Pleurocapsa sp. FMAR1]